MARCLEFQVGEHAFGLPADRIAFPMEFKHAVHTIFQIRQDPEGLLPHSFFIGVVHMVPP